MVVGLRSMVFGCSVAEVLREHADLYRDLDVVELWSGVGAIAEAAREAGFAAVEFDINRVPGTTDTDRPAETENILLEPGFKRALELTMRLRPGGILWMAPVCSSWVFLSLSRTKRKRGTRYEGNMGCRAVREGNEMARIAAFLYKVAHARGATPVLENPPSSTLFLYGPLVDSLAAVDAERHTAVCPHCAFSAARVGRRFGKKFKFMSTAAWVRKLARKCKCPGRKHIKLVKEKFVDGKRKATGCQALLRESAAYPKPLGRAVIQAWQSVAGGVASVSAAASGRKRPVNGPRSCAQDGGGRRSKVAGPRSQVQGRRSSDKPARSKVGGPRSAVGGRWWMLPGLADDADPGSGSQAGSSHASSCPPFRAWAQPRLEDEGHAVSGLAHTPETHSSRPRWASVSLDSDV